MRTTRVCDLAAQSGHSQGSFASAALARMTACAFSRSAIALGMVPGVLPFPVGHRVSKSALCLPVNTYQSSTTAVTEAAMTKQTNGKLGSAFWTNFVRLDRVADGKHSESKLKEALGATGLQLELKPVGGDAISLIELL
jgi:hypothetical protein